MPERSIMVHVAASQYAAHKQLSDRNTIGLPGRKLHLPTGTTLNDVWFAWNGAPQKTPAILALVNQERAVPRKIANSGWGPWGKVPNQSPVSNYWATTDSSSFMSANNTYLCWFKETRTTVGSGYPYSPAICMVGWHTSGNHGLGIDGGYLKVGTNSTTANKGTTYVADGAWHLAAFVNSGATNKYDVYVDVAGVMTKQNGSTPWTPYAASGLSMIGMGYNADADHSGPQDVAAWRVFTKSLTLSQLQEIYNNEVNTLIWVANAALGLYSIGSALNYDLTVLDPANGSIIYALVSGTLPSGLSISNGKLTGTLSGSPTTYNFTVKAQNTLGQSALRTFSLASDLAPVWSTAEGLVGTFTYQETVNLRLLATDNTSISSYTMLSGSLPSGLTLNTSTGYITGTAPLLGADTTYNFVVRATDTTANYTDRSFSIVVKKSIDAQFSKVELLLSDSLTDVSSRHRTVTVLGNAAPSYATTVYGLNTIGLDGSGDGFQFAYDANLANWYQGDYTLEFLMAVNDFTKVANSNRPIAVGGMEATSFHCDWSFGPRSATELVFQYWNGGSVIEASANPGTIPTGVLRHYAMTFTKSTNAIRLFYAGTLVKTVVGLTGTPSLGYALTFGMYNNASMNARFFDIRVSRYLRYSANFTPLSAQLPQS